MYASVRHYKMGAGSIDALMHRVDEEFAPAISQESGFVAYFAVATGDATLETLSIFHDKAPERPVGPIRLLAAKTTTPLRTRNPPRTPTLTDARTFAKQPPSNAGACAASADAPALTQERQRLMRESVSAHPRCEAIGGPPALRRRRS